LELGRTLALRQAAGLARGAAMPLWGALLLCALLCGCGGGADEPTRIEGSTATVYSSSPRVGVSEAAARAVVTGERRALADAGGRAGGLRIRLRELPTTEDEPDHPWDPALVSTNAHRAADDPSAIAYLGELDYGATAVSLPITNAAGLLQVSPGDGLTSLTQRPPGRPRDGPERYYPSDERTFVRVGPSDLDEAEWLVERVRASGGLRLATVFDRDIYGRELAGQIAALARRDGIEPVASEEWRGELDQIPEVVRELAETRPDAVIYLGVAAPGTGRLVGEIASTLPPVPLLASSGILAAQGSLALPAGPARIEAVGPVLAPERAGYDAMRLVLDAVDEGKRDRRRVIAAALRLRKRVAAPRLALYRLGADGRFERVGAAR
jgi:branched-chain amino acid transport system substrate-binding protein